MSDPLLQDPNPIRMPTLGVPIASCILVASCIAAGAAARQLAVYLESNLAAELSNAILFTPCSLAAIWIAWRTEPICKPSYLGMPLIVAGLIVCFLARYQIALGANSISAPDIPGYFSNQSFWIAMQAAHWLLFLATAWLVAKLLQWSTSIGIWSIRNDPPETEPGSLSLAKLLALTLLCAGLIATYQRWVLAWSPGLIGAFSKPAWYQFFPVGSRPWVAGFLGGILLPIHWLAIASIVNLLRRNRYRNIPLCVVLLGAWCLVAAGLQAGCSNLYFFSANILTWGPDGSATRWIGYSIGIPYNTGFVPSVGGFYSPEQNQFWYYGMRGVVQTCLVCLAILWLAHLGLRVGFYRDQTSDSKLGSPERLK